MNVREDILNDGMQKSGGRCVNAVFWIHLYLEVDSEERKRKRQRA